MILQGNPLITWGVALLLTIGTGCWVEAKQITLSNLQCHDNGSFSFEFPSEEVGKLTLFTYVEREFLLYKVCGYRRVSETRQLLEQKCEDYTPRLFDVRIFENKNNGSGNDIVISNDDVPRVYSTTFWCHTDYMPHSHGEITLEERYLGAYFPQRFTIWDISFHPVIIKVYNESTSFTRIGAPVKIEIEIDDNNLFGEKSHFQSCKLDIHYDDGHVESISILENSTVTPAGSLIDFRSRYTPGNGSQLAKYTVKFKAFVLRHPRYSYFNCQACVNCEPVCGDNFVARWNEYAAARRYLNPQFTEEKANDIIDRKLANGDCAWPKRLWTMRVTFYNGDRGGKRHRRK